MFWYIVKHSHTNTYNWLLLTRLPIDVGFEDGVGISKLVTIITVSLSMIKSTLIFLTLSLHIACSTAQTEFEFSMSKNEMISFWKADSLFNLGEYDNAIKYYKQSEPKHHFDLGWPIKKSLCYLLVGDTTSAQNYFKNYTSNGGYYMYVEQINQIPLFEVIAPDEQVRDQFKENTYLFEHSDSTCLYPEVLKSLTDMRALDQSYRQGNGDLNVSLTTIDSLNRIKLDSLINIYGWLGYKEVGKSGENASFLIAQHSDRDLNFQKKCLLEMKKQLVEGNIYPPNYALLYDRVKINNGEAQLFGSQVEINSTSNRFESKKTLSPELVNAYRLYFGLDTIESYLELMNKRNGLE